MTTTTTDLKTEIQDVIKTLERAKSIINTLASIQEGLEKGTGEFNIATLKEAKRGLLGNLTMAHTKISEIIAETSNI